MSNLHIRPSPDIEDSQLHKKARIVSNNESNTQTHKQSTQAIEIGLSGHPVISQSGKKPLTKKQIRKHNRKGQALPLPFSSEDVLWHDVVDTLGQAVANKSISDGTEWDAPFAVSKPQEVEATVLSISSSGEALAMVDDTKWIIVTPFALPGERIRCRVYKNYRLHSRADLLAIIEPNPSLRDDSRIKCRYFGKCSGCQYQLSLKQQVVIKAYQHFSGLPTSSVPVIEATIGSPLQYGYRTKLTPHFAEPPKKARNDPLTLETSQWLSIGFNGIGTRKVIDIEDCAIASPIINAAYTPMRQEITRNILNYKKGVSLLLRESLQIPTDSPDESAPEKTICVTNHKSRVRERVGPMIFEYPAHSFFQNNNSILSVLTSYVKDAIFPTSLESENRPTHLIDAYCGSGLFAITLSPHFETVAGIELDPSSVENATRNAHILNKLPESQITFRTGDAVDIFSVVEQFPPSLTALIIDPPRKGTDEPFIEQLLRFRAKTVVYVSCNVHTQARDVGMIISGSQSGTVQSSLIMVDGTTREANLGSKDGLAANGSSVPTLIDASQLKITLSENLKTPPAAADLVFGQIMTDHMLIVNFDPIHGWGAPEIKPYGPLILDPSSSCLQYCTSCFEGMKAYLGPDGKVRLFRPDLNMARFASSAARLALPPFDSTSVLNLIKKLVEIDARWIPDLPGYSLYIRPTIMGTRAGLGVTASDSAMLYVILSPTGPYFRTATRALSLLAGTDSVRSWPGGTGGFKLGANYAPAFLHQRTAAAQGYDQNLWLIGENRIITEAGAMNFFVVVKRDDDDFDVITPPLDGTILPGLTRQACIELIAAHPSLMVLPHIPPTRKLHMHEKQLTMPDLLMWTAQGKLLEAFGVGTAAIVASVGSIGYQDKDIVLPKYDGVLGPVTRALWERVVDIQQGRVEWKGWSVCIN